MKVLLVNGSPHKNGCTYTALCEVSSALNDLKSKKLVICLNENAKKGRLYKTTKLGLKILEILK